MTFKFKGINLFGLIITTREQLIDGEVYLDALQTAKILSRPPYFNKLEIYYE